MLSKDAKILIVDDMATMRKIVTKGLAGIGYTKTVEANDGALGWNAIETAIAANQPVQMVLCDWNMPLVSGLDLLKKVRSDPRTHKIPFIMISAETEKKQIDAASLAGVNAYLMKPFNDVQLAVQLKAAMEHIFGKVA